MGIMASVTVNAASRVALAAGLVSAAADKGEDSAIAAASIMPAVALEVLNGIVRPVWRVNFHIQKIILILKCNEVRCIKQMDSLRLRTGDWR
jgi:hypothetical protein